MEEDKKNSNSNPDSFVMAKTPIFKDLRKPTMSETYRNVCISIDKNQIKYIEKISEILLLNSPLPLFDENLMLNVIDILQLETEVFRIFSNQNDRQIKRILGCKWFFRALPFEICTSQILPQASFSLRCKIINKLSKHLQNTSEAEKYFEFVRANYDNQRADYLLPKCSSEFILNHFEKDKSILRHPMEIRILTAICKRYPEVGLHILEHIFTLLNDQYQHGKFKRIILHLAGNHQDLFLPFLRKHHSLLVPETFGRKVTKKLGRKLQEEFLSKEIGTLPFKSKVLFSLLTFEGRLKALTEVFCHKTKELSFHTWARSTYKFCEYLKWIKQEDRLFYIEETFKKLFNLNFNDNSKCWNRELLELLPLETRKPFLLKMDKFFNEDESVFNNNMPEGFFIRCPEEFIYLYKFSIAFEKLKAMLRTTPMPRRRMDIIRQMVKNCSINADLEGLQAVVDYVVTRHRNEDCEILYEFILLVLNEFPKSALTSDTFEKLSELFHLCSLRNDPPQDVHALWKERHIYHLIDSGEDTDALLKNYFETVLLKRVYGTFLSDYSGRHSKTLLVKLCGMALSWIRSNPSDRSSNALFECLISTCINYSRAKPDTRIWEEVPGLSEHLVERLRNKYREAGGQEWELDVWARHDYDITVTDYNPKCLQYVLIRKPDLVDRYLEGIVNCLLSVREYTRDFRMYKSCLHFVLKAASFYRKTERVKELILTEFKTGKSFEKRKMALNLYSQVSTIEEFGKAVEEYLPRHERIEAHSDVDFGKIQLMIPTLIRNVRPRWRNFDLLLKFFMGDFSKTAKSSLHACCHYTRVDVVVPFLKNLLSTFPPKVSYLKDVIKLIAELSTRDETIDFCLESWKKHSHYTIRTILFYFVSKLFVERPTRESFAALEKCVLDSDPVVITKMPRIETVPDEFLEEYVDALMRFSEGQPAAFKNNFQSSVLSNFCGKRIKTLSEDFSERIIKNHLFGPGSGLDVKHFACCYLTEGPNSAQSRVRKVFDLMSQKKPPPSEALAFLEMVRQVAMPNLTAFGDLFLAVLDNWPKYPPGILYEERLLYTYSSLYQKAAQRAPDPELPAAELATELRELYSSVDDLSDVVVIFGQALKKFLGSFGAAKGVAMVRELVSGSKERNVGIVGVWALPKEAVCWFRAEDDPLNQSMAKQKKAVNEVFKILESYDDAVVEIFLRRKFYAGE